MYSAAVRLWPLAFALAGLTVARNASADEPPPETADGSTECHAMQDKNDAELALYEKRQPPTPYVYPDRPDTVVNAPWGQFFKGVWSSRALILSTFIPHLGAQYRGGGPSILISFPWSILVFGPMYSCSRQTGTYVVDGHRVHRIMLEPGMNSGSNGIGFHVRPGYRFIWHPSSWVVGPGLGIGSTVEVVGNREPFRYSIGPEAVAHFGNCCAANYFTFALRYDHYLKGVNRDILGGSLGYTFF